MSEEAVPGRGRRVIELIEYVCGLDGLTAYERAAFLVLVRHARFKKNGPGRTHIGAERVARESGQSVRQVRRSLKTLRERGLISVRRVYRDGLERTNTTSLIMPLA